MRTLALLAAGLLVGPLLADDKKMKDEEAILGTWKIEKYDIGGDKKPDEETSTIRVKFDKEGKATMSMGQRPAQEAKYKLDASANPKVIDMMGPDGKPGMLGIYELSGDTLKIQWNPKVRPKEFKAEGEQAAVMTFKRVKDEKKDK